MRFAVLVLVVGVFSALASHAAPAAAATTTVNIGDNWFSNSAINNCGNPCVTNIDVGDTVHWVWIGSLGHSTTSNMTGWNSGVHGNGFTFDKMFNTPGSFSYTCTVHPAMQGTIVVAAAAVGGIAELPNVSGAPAASATSSDGRGGIVAGVVAATALVVALGGGALYARRRRGE